MDKLAFYGKGGIGKSTTVSNMAVAWAQAGHRVMQIGCDPKADSTMNLLGGRPPMPVIDALRTRGRSISLEEIVTPGYAGVLCVETGGPRPGLGCAGRGIIAALELLDDKGAYEIYQPDIVLFDVLGDVVCGGFSMPIRKGYADKVFIITSGEAMALHASMNIALAVETFQERGYARLGGVILNRRDVRTEQARVASFCEDIGSRIVGELEHSRVVTDADELHQTVLEAFPESDVAAAYRRLAGQVLAAARQVGAGGMACTGGQNAADGATGGQGAADGAAGTGGQDAAARQVGAGGRGAADGEDGAAGGRRDVGYGR